MLALAGGLVAAMPWVPVLRIDPPLALALFISALVLLVVVAVRLGWVMIYAKSVRASIPGHVLKAIREEFHHD